MKMSKSEIVEFFSGKSVLLTGVTGYVGEAVAEKILRACPGVQNVFALVRPKKEPDAVSRLKKQVKFSPVFQKIRSDSKDPEKILSKLIPIHGDVSLPNLGISSKDRDLLCSQVSVVIHSAANVKWYQKIKSAVNTNVQGTRRVLELCKEMKDLQSLVHVSTTYCNFKEHHLEEIVYPTEIDPNEVIQMLQLLPDDIADMITPRLIGGDPFCYPLTKRLGENLVQKYYREYNLPAAILRPANVGPAYEDWAPGLASKAQMCSRYFLEIGFGKIRSMKGDNSVTLEQIPVEHVVNQILAVAWAHSQPPKSESKPHMKVKVESTHLLNGEKDESKMIPVYHSCIGQDNPVTWGEVLKYLDGGIQKYPFNNMDWFPVSHSVFTRSSFYHYLRLILFNFLPIVVKDTCVDLKHQLFGPKSSKKRVGHVEKFVQFSKELNAISLITLNPRTFDKKNTWLLWHKMNKVDQQLFNFDVREINWPRFMESHMLGLKKYVLKEDMDDPKCKTRLKMLWGIHRGLQLMATSLIFVFGWNSFAYFQNSRQAKRDSHAPANHEEEQIQKKESNQSEGQVDLPVA